MTKSPKFKIGQLVEKWTGDYTGPGRIRGISTLENGKIRYLVGHRIEGGTGEFLHVYAEGNLCALTSDAARVDGTEVGRLNGLLAASRAQQLALEAAALDFIAKVERGEVRSRRSYAAFKAALDGEGKVNGGGYSPPSQTAG